MAAVTGAVIGGLSAAGGIYQAIEGAQQARDAQNALNDLPIPNLQNSYDDMRVSQLGANLQREEGARQFATSVDALRSGGIRGIVGGLGQVNAQQNLINRQIAANLDEQQKNIDFARAGDQSVIRAMKEQRYQSDVAALSSQISAGNQMKMQGIKGAMQGAASGVQMYQQGKYMDALTNATKAGGLTTLSVPASRGLIGMSGAQIGSAMDLSALSSRSDGSQFNPGGQGMFGTPNPYTSANPFGTPRVDMYGNIIR